MGLPSPSRPLALSLQASNHHSSAVPDGFIDAGSRTQAEGPRIIPSLQCAVESKESPQEGVGRGFKCNLNGSVRTGVSDSRCEMSWRDIQVKEHTNRVGFGCGKRQCSPLMGAGCSLKGRV